MSWNTPELSSLSWIDYIVIQHFSRSVTMSFLCTNGVLVLAFLSFIVGEISVHIFVHVCVQSIFCSDIIMWSWYKLVKFSLGEWGITWTCPTSSVHGYHGYHWYETAVEFVLCFCSSLATTTIKLFIAHEFVMSNRKTHKFWETLQLYKARLCSWPTVSESCADSLPPQKNSYWKGRNIYKFLEAPGVELGLQPC